VVGLVKVKEKILRVMLILMIGLSFYLTYLLWAGPSNHDLISDNSKEVVKKEEKERNPIDIFLPLTLRYEVRETNYMSQNETLLKEVQLAINESRFTKIKEKTFKVEEYQTEVKSKRGIELAYSFLFPLTQYIDLFDLDFPLETQTSRDFTFSKIQIDFEKRKIRFLNDEQLRIVEATIDSQLSPFTKLLKEVETNWILVEPSPLSNNLFVSVQEMELKKYSYISSMRPYTLFRDAFFTMPANVRSTNNSLDVHLFDSAETLTIQQNSSEFQFQGTIDTKQPFEIYQTSFDFVREISPSYGSTRMIDQVRNTIDYRIFVEGFPIFGSFSEGRLFAYFSDNKQIDKKNITIDGNLNSLQIPIPSEELIQLPTSHEVVQKLEQAGGEIDQIKMFLIGYKWENIQDTGVVDLIPQWYLKYGETWYTYDKLYEKIVEEKGRGNGF
jgi:regulatory protein YycH of two-component signal transduction system YycFG